MPVPIARLHLDSDNPRLPEEVQGRPDPELLQYLYDHFALEEIAAPMAENGYFDEEPLVAIPDNLPKRLLPKAGEGFSPEFLDFLRTAEFTVVEGNRRLATARILLDDKLRQQLRIRSWPAITDAVRDDLRALPVIVYSSRTEVLPYLGVRHITGNKKWDSYAKARYIDDMLKGGYSIGDIEKEVGDRSQSVIKNAVAYKTLQQAKREFDFNLDRAKGDFSYILLGIGQRNIKLFLGWQKTDEAKKKTVPVPLEEISLDEPVPDSHLANLKSFLSWIYGEGSKILPVIKESRDITNYLVHVVASREALGYLEKTRDLRAAYDLSDGEEAMVKKLLGKANKSLETVLGVAHRNKTTDVRAEAMKCAETAGRVVKAVSD